jgi:hypothetical protein
MLRRWLIRLRFMPVMGRLFDYLPAGVQLVWFGETGTAPPGPVAVPPRGSFRRQRRGNALEDLAIVCLAPLAGFLIGGATTAIVFVVVGLAVAVSRWRRRR